MNVGAINHHGYDTANIQREQKAAAGFAKTIDQAGQENAVDQMATDSEKPVFRWLYSANGSTGEVYKAQDYTLEHPVYRIKSWDATGNLTEHVIDVSQVDPKNCNTYEMYAYAANLKETGKR